MKKASSLQEIFVQAKNAVVENKTVYEQALELEKLRAAEKEQDEQEKRQFQVKKGNPETDNCSEELYEYIQEFGFTIDSYEKYELTFDRYGYPVDETLEMYYCSFGAWEFKIRNVADVDIEEGIFSLSEIIHKETGEKVNFYCDLGCRNTSEARRDEVLDFLTYPSLETYIQDAYGKYLRLPELLRKKGLNVEEIDFSFGLNSPKGYLTIEKNLYVKVYRAWFDDLKVVVTNDSTWDVNSSNDHWGRKKAYYFDYRSVDDIDELIRCIKAFKEEQEGKIGYYENGQYYRNQDVVDFYDSLRSKEDYYKDAWNHYEIQIEHNNKWDQRGYEEEESTVLNKYKGLELFVTTELTFNDAAQWSKGDLINKSFITFEYDKRKSDQCRLFIQNYVYEDELTYYDEEKESHVIDETKCVATFEQFGSFLELMEILKSYVYTMIDIHEVEI